MALGQPTCPKWRRLPVVVGVGEAVELLGVEAARVLLPPGLLLLETPASVLLFASQTSLQTREFQLFSTPQPHLPLAQVTVFSTQAAETVSLELSD